MPWAKAMDIKKVMSVPIQYQLDQLHQADGYVCRLDQSIYQLNLYIPREIADTYEQVYIKINLFVEKHPLDSSGQWTGKDPVTEIVANPDKINIGAVVWNCMDEPPYQIISKSISTLRDEDKKIRFGWGNH